MSAVTALTDRPLELGEGARWVDGRLVFVDILSGALYEHPGVVPGEAVLLAEVDVPLGAVAPLRRSEGWIAAAGDGIALLAPGSPPQWVDRPEQRHSGLTRMNDAVCDPAGRFWAGSMAYDGTSPLGSVYRVDPGGEVVQVLDGLVIANGPAFSPDGTTMFLADTGRKTVSRYDVSPGGEVSSPSVVLREESAAGPDGMVTDEQGTLWIAMWGGHQVRRYSPAGDLMAIVDLPSVQPTSIAMLGGLAVITTARIGLERPAAADGLVLAVDLPALGIEATGLPTRAFG